MQDDPLQKSPGVTAELVSPKIAFNKPCFIGPELVEIQDAILNNMHISGVGPYTLKCEQMLASWYGSPVLLVSSCTHALEMAAHLLDLKPGDGVIVPSYTFVSSANAFALRGCTIQFADCDQYGQLCLESLKRYVTPETRAVCVVHYAGHSTDMEALTAFCRKQGLALVEDAAQAIGATYKGIPLGSFGDLGCLSFHETKNVTSGEGGALIVNNTQLLDRAHHIREKGTNRTQFLQGFVDKYTWVDIGSSYLMSDINAAYLWVQLNHLDEIHARRRKIWLRYRDELTPCLEVLQARLLDYPSYNESNSHIFALIFSTSEYRARFIDFMKSRAITTPFHYVALHASPKGQCYSADAGGFSATLELSQGLVRLPLFYNMTDVEQQQVIEAVIAFSETL